MGECHPRAVIEAPFPPKQGHVRFYPVQIIIADPMTSFHRRSMQLWNESTTQKPDGSGSWWRDTVQAEAHIHCPTSTCTTNPDSDGRPQNPDSDSRPLDVVKGAAGFPKVGPGTWLRGPPVRTCTAVNKRQTESGSGLFRWPLGYR